MTPALPDHAYRNAALEEAIGACMRAVPDQEKIGSIGQAAHYVACADAIRDLQSSPAPKLVDGETVLQLLNHIEEMVDESPETVRLWNAVTSQFGQSPRIQGGSMKTSELAQATLYDRIFGSQSLAETERMKREILDDYDRKHAKVEKRAKVLESPDAGKE